MLKENLAGYASPMQREVLAGLCVEPRIERSFFLTGGTALSVFYLAHRVSEDLDLFSVETADIPEIGFWITRNWPGESASLRQSPGYASLEINGIRVDLAVDPLSEKTNRERFVIETGRSIAVDTIENIASNKLAALASRIEPKDFIDFYFIRRLRPNMELRAVFEAAKKKEAVFDDPPTAAYQIEEGFERLPGLSGERTFAGPAFPRLLKRVDERDFCAFYRDLASWIYERR